MSKRVDNICDRLWRAIDHSKDDPVDVLNALWAVYTRQVSLMSCPDCREQAVHALEASCPDMLKYANTVSSGGVLYNGNTTLRDMANTLFTAINESGDIS